MAKMTIAKAREEVKNWPEGYKNRVRVICAEWEKSNKVNPQGTLKINAPFSFIQENCFRKGTMIGPEDVLACLEGK